MTNQTLVVGATGNVGRRLVEILAAQGVAVKAATRQPAGYDGPQGVQAVDFDLDRPETFGPALAGVDRAFVIARSGDAQPQKALNALFDQAKAAGVQHIAFLTAAGAEMNEEVGLRKAERHLMATGLDYTILRPTWFMQNFSTGFIQPMIAQMGAIYLPAGDGKTSFIDAADIAAVAATVLTQPGHAGQAYTLTGGEALSYGEAAAIVSEVAGRPVGYVAIPNDAFRQSLIDNGWPAESAGFMAGLFQPVEQGWAAAVSPAVATILGRAPVTFRQFASENAASWR
jgi:uncharacterized protein YbjT (DUF2867 family)